MESEKNSKTAKEEKPQLPLNASLPLSGTQEHPLAPLRGESTAEGRIDYTLVNLMKEVKKNREGIRKDIKKCKRRSHNHRSVASYR
ncbi:hypothetical protein LR48_Vigan530s000300 [Vigna angularis]|uniref:Uncharacterized protein n=1 Tax=Phaseolus angularis TaxID=3914 RepID=A0A0L9TD68_PHAAN|nr:hypothetical protein LR48_Vigan530s000300 [Vigna angularis]